MDRDETPPQTLLSPRQVLLAFFPSIVLPMFLAAIDQTIISTALPAIAGELGDVGRLSWVIVAYLIAATIATPIYGRLGDALGRRRMMYVALGFFLVASALCAAAGSILALSAARVLQGLGGGGLMALSQALIGENVPARERGRYQGYLATVFVGAAAIGPVAGGFLTQHFGWQSVFVVNLPLGAAAFVLLLRLPGGSGGDGRVAFDYAGTVLFILAVIPLLLALEQAQALSVARLPAIGLLLAITCIAGVLLVRQERRAAAPLLPLKLLREPTIWRACLLGACIGGIIVPLVSFTPIYMQVVRGLSPSETGLLLLPLTAGIPIGSMITGQFVTRTGRGPIFPSVGQPAVVVLLLVLAFLLGSLTLRPLVVLLAAISLCTGTGMVVVQTLTQIVAGPRHLGAIAASVQLARALGASFGTALVSAVLFGAIALHDGALAGLFAELLQNGQALLAGLGEARAAEVRAALGGAFRAAYVTMAAIAAVGAVMAWTIPRRRF